MTQIVEVPYNPRGSAWTIFENTDNEVVISGPSGTGKTRACLEKLNQCAFAYPGMRGAIVRKTRQSMTQSVIVTWEKKVIPWWLGEKIVFRTTEQEYRYSNGSVIALAGLDKASKILSTEFDIAFANQAEELAEADWEFLTTRLRHGVMPYQQMAGDCNPDQPRHWLKLRGDVGRLTMLESRHKDNPELWRAGGWTLKGKAYIEKLDALTGVRYLRLRKGIWAAAEGMVYEDWDRNAHLVGFEVIAHRHTRWVASVDWGFTNPGVIQVWALDSDDRMYLVREVYRSRKTIDWWIGQALALHKEFRKIEVFVCDPSEPGFIQQFRGAGLPTEGAITPIAEGVQAVQQRLRVQRDGRPRLFFVRNALRERDELLFEAKLPCCSAEEIDGYVWPKGVEGKPIKEQPVKFNDHGMDAMRYAVMYVDSRGRLLVSGPAPWGADYRG